MDKPACLLRTKELKEGALEANSLDLNPGSTTSCCMALGKSLNLSEPPFSYL